MVYRDKMLIETSERRTPNGEKYFEVYINQVLVGEMVMNNDGYYVFFYNNDRGGYWESAPLRMVADKLDEMNTEWDMQVKSDLEKLDEKIN
jgi:hypothetical protein